MISNEAPYRSGTSAEEALLPPHAKYPVVGKLLLKIFPRPLGAHNSRSAFIAICALSGVLAGVLSVVCSPV